MPDTASAAPAPASNMFEVMSPHIQRFCDQLGAARVAHMLCREQLVLARADTIPANSIPADYPIVFNNTTKSFSQLLVARLQLNKLAMWDGSGMRAGKNLLTFNVVECYQPPPVVLGILWGKPYCRVMPLPGITPADYRDHYPGFHYRESKSSSVGNICVGDAFAIGDATNVLDQLPKLIEVLSWVNLTDSMLPIHDAANRGGVWPTWANAITKVQKGQEQGVLIPLKQFSL